MSDVRHCLELIRHADHSLVRTVDGLPDGAYTEPSLLPGWTRGHVVAHLALNAEGLARVLMGARLGEPQTMYDSPEGRNEDIEELAAAPLAELRDRVLAGTTRFEQAAQAMRDQDWQGRFDRTPGGQSLAVAKIPLMRAREVEIHHADLDAGYTPSDWSPAFRELLLHSMTKRSYPAPFTARATDLGSSWAYGEGGGDQVVTGDAAALGWWLTGRGSGEGLTCDGGALPRTEPW